MGIVLANYIYAYLFTENRDNNMKELHNYFNHIWPVLVLSLCTFFHLDIFFEIFKLFKL